MKWYFSIYLSSGSSNVLILENSIISNYTSGNEYAIYVDADSNKISIVDNYLISDNWNRYSDNAIYAPSANLTNNELYYVYGVTEEECDYFEELIDSMDKQAGRKYYVCEKKCKKRDACRSWAQYEEAQKYRIIVTTHRQYEHFYNTPESRKQFEHQW